MNSRRYWASFSIVCGVELEIHVFPSCMVYIYIYIYIYTHIYMCMCKCNFMSAYVYMYVYAYIIFWVYTCMHMSIKNRVLESIVGSTAFLRQDQGHHTFKETVFYICYNSYCYNRSVYLSIHLCRCICVCTSVNIDVCMYVCIYVCMCHYRSI